VLVLELVVGVDEGPLSVVGEVVGEGVGEGVSPNWLLTVKLLNGVVMASGAGRARTTGRIEIANRKIYTIEKRVVWRKSDWEAA